MDGADLGEAVLRMVEVADSPGGAPVLREAVESVERCVLF